MNKDYKYQNLSDKLLNLKRVILTCKADMIFLSIFSL